MSFKGINVLDANNFCKLLREPKPLKIISISDPKKSMDKDPEGNNKFYIKIGFELLNQDKEAKMTFNIKLEDGLISIYSDMKLYPLISFVTELESNKITCYHEDLKDILTNYEFIGIAEPYSIARKQYYKIIPIEKIINSSNTNNT